MFHNEISYTFPDLSSTMYWSLPSVFTGNKVKSYGGQLEFMQRYTSSGRYVPDRDVIIVGNGITLFWSNPIELRPDVSNVSKQEKKTNTTDIITPCPLACECPNPS